MILPSISCRRGGVPGKLTIAIEMPPRGFDPRFSTGNSISARIMQLIYDTLMVKNERFEIVPSLADSVQISPDNTLFVFHLRDGITFHDGKNLTSADVKYTFMSMLSPEMKSPLRGTFDKISSIDTPDPLTVVFRAREPFYTFIGSLPAVGIIPEGAGIEMGETPIGSGPYKLTKYLEGQSVFLESNAAYWGSPPLISNIEIKIIADNSTRQAALMSGEVDLAYNAQFDPETVRAFNGRRDMKVIIGDGTNIGHLGVNLTSPFLSNQKVRQAIAYAIDRDSIIHRLLRDQARRADSILPPEQWAFEPDVRNYEYNPDLARKLLDEAGFPDPGGDGAEPRLRITILTSTSQLPRNIATIIQDQLRHVGINLELQSLELATMMDRINKGQFDLYYLISIGGNQTPEIFQYVYYSRYQNPEFNYAVSKLRAASEASSMKPIFERIESILSNHDYCQNVEVNQLVEQAASLDSTSDAAAKKRLYVRIAGMLTDRGGANRSRYCNPEIDRRIIEAERATDLNSKKELYSKIQKTVSEELPQIYLWYPSNVLVARDRVDNIHIDLSGSWHFICKLTLN